MDALDRLEQTLRERRDADPASSYVASLFAKGRLKIAQKLGEEAVETVIAATAQPDKIVSEAADLLFHLAVLLADAGLSLDDVRVELARREGVSGHDEKAARAAPPAGSSSPLPLTGADHGVQPAADDALPLPNPSRERDD